MIDNKSKHMTHTTISTPKQGSAKQGRAAWYKPSIHQIDSTHVEGKFSPSPVEWDATYGPS